MRHPIAFIILTGLFLPMAASAQQSPATECRERVNLEFGKEQRYYRAIIFGKKKAEYAQIGEVRYDEEGIAWIKKSMGENDGDGEWVTSHPDYANVTWYDTQMDLMDEHAGEQWQGGTEDGGNNDRYVIGQRGIFETKRMQTSELIPYLLQAIRALQCRLNTVCEQVRLSIAVNHDEEQPRNITKNSMSLLACNSMEDKRTFPECHTGAGGDTSLVDMETYCETTAARLLQREMDLMRLSVEYDAAYRSLLQFAGGFDQILESMQWTLTGTVRYATGLINKLTQIPCFISSCDSFPESHPIEYWQTLQQSSSQR